MHKEDVLRDCHLFVWWRSPLGPLRIIMWYDSSRLLDEYGSYQNGYDKLARHVIHMSHDELREFVNDMIEGKEMEPVPHIFVNRSIMTYDIERRYRDDPEAYDLSWPWQLSALLLGYVITDKQYAEALRTNKYNRRIEIDPITNEPVQVDVSKDFLIP